jgi:adenine-specific DNA-methyltransferase
MARRAPSKASKKAEAYRHEDEALLRPDVGTQAQFRKKKPPKSYRYDSSLSPALDWDGQNPVRELGEWLLEQIDEASRLNPPHLFAEPRRFGNVEVAGLADAIAQVKALSRPFLDWAGKAERLSFDVPTLPLFVHERLSTKAILETLKGHKRDRQLDMQLFADPELPLHEQLKAYEHRGGWVNRMILGDSLVVMNSMLEYEGLGGQVQMIYLDPPYGVKFGSNFQPFVRSREVKDGSDDDLTREPEMVKAYRDTWELGVHSYLTYMRDRLLVARELLGSSGSVFVQIGEENVHHVREIADDVFGSENFVSLISVKKTATPSQLIDSGFFYVIWYARDLASVKYRQLWLSRRATDWLRDTPGGSWGVEIDGVRRPLEPGEKSDPDRLPANARIYALSKLTSAGAAKQPQPFVWEGETFHPASGTHWKTTSEGLARLSAANRLESRGGPPWFTRFHDDFPFVPLTNLFEDTAGKSAKSIYVVQTQPDVIERCMLMTTDPGDLVVDPTCGSGTTAFVAEQWGRRWITMDTSRVPLALARQRLLTATFPYFELQDQPRGPVGGFVYERRQNRKGDEVGGIIPHVTLGSIANDEPPAEEVLVNRPEVDARVTRVTGPFAVEATIPTPVDYEGDGIEDSGMPEDPGYVDRMLETLRLNPVLRLGGGTTIELTNVRPPAVALTLSGEATLQPENSPVAVVFGPENGAVSEKLVYEAAREAHLRSYEQLIVIGFAIEPQARTFVDSIEQSVGIPASYVQATPDLVMGDLLKTMRSSELFSVTGLPDVAIRAVEAEEAGGQMRFEVELRGVDIFDPSTFETTHRGGNDVPAWFLDTAWNGLSFHVSQAFFPRTGAWDALRRSLRGEFEDEVWEHLAGAVSAPFTQGETRDIAVKVIDDRGNELLVVKSLDEAE